MKANIEVATARDCQESRGKRVYIIVVLLTSFRSSNFSICTNTAFALHAIKAKADNFFETEGVILIAANLYFYSLLVSVIQSLVSL